ncbi:nucleoside diphosphate-linked moiety X motif 19, mitochondrial [Platysternon megacephalum]|uniref:Nucleoside diphosphate-linked moiety X motif 19, mitochondrial n=1 Tax=Platysternon megacephalum TaxID=55544 RepID=A0A4D9F5M5_9SAUR|nr:nucleoside diphosphate-linked moiety X motif 19, mitochondrial [Platysternon megacephalum]
MQSELIIHKEKHGNAGGGGLYFICIIPPIYQVLFKQLGGQGPGPQEVTIQINNVQTHEKICRKRFALCNRVLHQSTVPFLMRFPKGEGKWLFLPLLHSNVRNMS